ncbi:Ig domain protein group 2 domain protein [Brenneria sp. EniD312]|nr:MULTISPECIES: Ig-like domain-containing protein [Brenneria]EHD21333.1 Ig domain protein group 2 domain protein [Brenneria sp. EniD312]
MRKIGSLTNTADNNGEFTDGYAAAGIKPTLLLAGWHNTIQRELAAIVEGAGEDLDPNDDEQISKIIGQMSAVISHYRNYGYPEWESAIPYYEGAVVYYNGYLYLSLLDNNVAQVPGTDDSKWQPYIQREATEAEAIAGEGSEQVITPRRLHAGASYLDDQLKTALTPYLTGIGEITLWGGPESLIPKGKLRCNGQSFDVELNPILALQYPDGRVPNIDDRYVIGASDSNPVGTLREADWEHYHPVGQWQADSGYGADDADFISGRSISKSGGDLSKWGGKNYYSRGNSGEWQGIAENTVPRQNASDSIDTGDLIPINDGGMHPADIGLYYIIKTDQAESEQGTGAPTAIVITPAAVTVNAGTTRQFTGTVLPASLADDYPVSWAVSDPTLGSIDSNGLYTATAGQSGTQTIIASISTGLTATATVTQHIYLTSITIGTVPLELIAGNTYNIPIAYSPAGYTESVNPASSDASVAALSSAGTLTISGAGTATLSLTGASSGVTALVTITATEEEVPEVYLQIENNLSEIAAAGATAQSEARDALDLGELATKDSLTASDVGAVPQSTESLGTADLNTVLTPGREFQSLTSNATLARNYPIALAGMLDVIKTTASGIRQVYYPYNNTDVYHRYCVDVGTNPMVFGTWVKGGGFLEASQNLADVADVAQSRQNLGVSYTISADVAPTDATGYAAGHIWYQIEE